MEKEFVLLNGYVKLNNEQLFIKKKNKEIKERGGYTGIIFILILFSLFRSFNNLDTLKKISDYINIFLQCLGFLVIIYLFYYMIFKKKWSKKLYINDIEKVSLDKDEFETEITIMFSNKREIFLGFRNLENQIEPFIAALKKRNNRISIQHNY